MGNKFIIESAFLEVKRQSWKHSQSGSVVSSKLLDYLLVIGDRWDCPAKKVAEKENFL